MMHIFTISASEEEEFEAWKKEHDAKIRADGIREFAKYLVIDGYIRYGFEADYLVNQFMKKEQSNG